MIKSEVIEIGAKAVSKANPCYVAFDKKRSLVYTANYHKRQIDVYRLNNDKTLTLCDSWDRTYSLE